MADAMLIEIAVAAASGGAVGWITNSIAVNMLFRKYGPWGGLIEERYEEFIENISDLAETDLLNHKTLRTACNGPAFKAVLRAWIEDILRHELPEKTGTLRLEEIPGIEKTAAELIAFARDAEQNAQETLRRIFQDAEIQTLLSKEQYYYLAGAYTRALFSPENQSRLKIILRDFLLHSEHTFCVSNEAVSAVIARINRAIERIDTNDIDAVFSGLLNVIDIDRMTCELASALEQMSYADIIKDRKSFFQECISRLAEFSATPEGQASLSDTAAALLEDAKYIRIKPADALSPGVQDGAVRFIGEAFPEFMNSIAVLVENSRDEISAIINDTVNRHLETSIQGIVLIGIKEFFIGDLSKEYNVTDKIAEGIRKYGITGTDGLVKKAVSILADDTVGNLIETLQKQGILEPQELARFLSRVLTDLPKKEFFGDILSSKEFTEGKNPGDILSGKEFTGKKNSGIAGLLDAKIGDGFKAHLAKIQTTVLPGLFGKLKEEYLYRDSFKRDLQSKCAAAITETLKPPGMAAFLSDRIPGLEKPLKKALMNGWTAVSVKKIGGFISARNALMPWENIWNRYKSCRIGRAYRAIQKDSIYDGLACGILNRISRHLNTLASGNVSKLVKTELKKSNPGQIRTMVQDFIGKELKPITVFGAFLGGIAGSVFAAAEHLIGVPRGFVLPIFLLYGLIFAGVGIGTNWLAIKMLFRPYKKILFNVPPFIGVAPARKPEFAKSIAVFIKNQTLRDETLRLFFTANKKALQESIARRITGFDLSIPDKKIDGIAVFVFSALRDYAIQNSDSIAESIEKYAQDYILTEKDFFPRIRDYIMRKLRETDPAPYLYAFIAEAVKGKNLGDCFEKPPVTAETLLKALTPERIKTVLMGQNARFTAYIETRSFEDFAGIHETDELILRASEKAAAVLRNNAGVIAAYIKDKAFNPDTKLKNMFGGKIAGLLDYTIDLAIKAVGSQKSVLTKHIADALPWYAITAKPHIAPIVAKLVDEELPAFLKRKKTEILSIVESSLEYRLSDMGFSGDALRREVIEQTLRDILDAPNVRRSIARFAQSVLKQYAKLPLAHTLDLLHIKSVQDLVNAAEPLLNSAVSYISSRLQQDDASAFIDERLKIFIKKTAEAIPLSELFAEIDLEKEMRTITASLRRNTQTMDAVSALLLDILKKAAENGDCYNRDSARKDAARFIADSVKQRETQLQQMCAPLLQTLLRNLHTIIPAETKQAVCEKYLIPAALDAGEKRFKEIIDAIDVRQVVEREVNAMPPAQIEKLFYKFAGVYFTKITIYGWIGLFGGLLSYLIALLLALLFG
ncbi:MAG: DUF445 family protein [Spirochaetaceae bacterium]|jgi:uncharacterized membrane protein YheB (UPF0754 family)|nr:DUF445 family protein [Spirochaetaceae bacterium]